MTMSLSNARQTRREVKPYLLIYGGGGVGKSTFAASAPSPIFISAEDGLMNIDAKALTPSTWPELIECVDSLTRETHQYETVVIDSLDWAEPLCWAEVCRKGGKRDIEAFGYGKGYKAAVDEWRTLLKMLATLRATKNMQIVLIAHALLSKVQNPEGDDYDRWSIKLQDSKNCSAAGLIYEWCDIVGFASHEVVTDDTSGRAKGFATGKRVLRTQPSAAFYAKTRLALPKSILLDLDAPGGPWAAFARAVSNNGPGAIERLKAELETKLASLGDEDVERGARTFLRTRGESVGSLSEALATVDTYINERTKKAG